MGFVGGGTGRQGLVIEFIGQPGVVDSWADDASGWHHDVLNYMANNNIAVSYSIMDSELSNYSTYTNRWAVYNNYGIKVWVHIENPMDDGVRAMSGYSTTLAQYQAHFDAALNSWLAMDCVVGIGIEHHFDSYTGGTFVVDSIGLQYLANKAHAQGKLLSKMINMDTGQNATASNLNSTTLRNDGTANNLSYSTYYNSVGPSSDGYPPASGTRGGTAGQTNFPSQAEINMWLGYLDEFMIECYYTGTDESVGPITCLNSYMSYMSGKSTPTSVLNAFGRSPSSASFYPWTTDLDAYGTELDYASERSLATSTYTTAKGYLGRPFNTVKSYLTAWWADTNSFSPPPTVLEQLSYLVTLNAAVGTTETPIGPSGPSTVPLDYLAAVGRGAGLIDLFKLYGGTLYWKRTTDGTNWTPWTSMNMTSASSPVAVLSGSGDIDVFVSGSDTYARWIRWDHTPGYGWGSWQSLSGHAINGNTKPSACAFGSYVDLFITGADNIPYHRQYNGSSWGSWDAPGAGSGVILSPTSCYVGGTLFWFVNSSTNNTIYYMSSNNWGTWYPLSGLTTGANNDPVCASDGSRVILVMTDASNNIYSNIYYGGWSGWTSVASGAGTSPIMYTRDSAVDLIVRGSSGTVYMNTCSGGSWGSWGYGLDEATTTSLAGCVF